MLKGIDSALTAELLSVLMSMGHGDDVLICDVNHPAASIAKGTVHGKVIDLAGCDIPRAAWAILSVMPLDDFVERPVAQMAVVGDADRIMPAHEAMKAVVDETQGREVPFATLERFAFYETARKAFAVVRTSDPGPYGCFLLRKGVVAF